MYTNLNQHTHGVSNAGRFKSKSDNWTDEINLFTGR